MAPVLLLFSFHLHSISAGPVGVILSGFDSRSSAFGVDGGTGGCERTEMPAVMTAMSAHQRHFRSEWLFFDVLSCYVDTQRLRSHLVSTTNQCQDCGHILTGYIYF